MQQKFGDYKLFTLNKRNKFDSLTYKVEHGEGWNQIIGWFVYPQEIYTFVIKSEMNAECDLFKIVVIGSSGTGKTNISTRYIRDQFMEGQKTTVGV